MTAAIDITAGQRKTLLALLRRFIPGIAVWAYGSRVKWTARPNSDLDLVAFTTPAQRPIVFELKEALGESDLPFLVDFHVWDEVPERFHEIIRKEYVVLQEARYPIEVPGMVGDSKAAARAHLADAGVNELPDDWDVIELGDLLSEERGISVGVMYPGDHDPDGVPLIKAGDMNGSIINPHPEFRISREKHNEYRRTALEGGELLMTLVGNVGQCAVVPPRMAGWNTARAVAVMRLKDQSDVHFVQQCLLSRPLQHLMDVWCNTTVQATLNLKEIRQLPLPWPPKSCRDAIAAIGKALDDKIELNRRMNATLEAMARALFQSWFVDFDPVRAKLDGRKPASLDAATAALFPAHFQDSEHGKLPVDWRHISIEELCAINARTLGKSDDLDMLEYVEISEVNRGNIANITIYQRGEEPSRARRRLRHGDTVLSTVRPDRGSYFLALNPPVNRVASTGFAVLTPTKAPWSFIHAAMTQPEVSDYLGQMADGGAYPAVRPEIIGSMKVALPNEPKILEAFHRTCAPLFEQAEANRTQSHILATTRDALLPKLLSGELSVNPEKLPCY